MTLEENVQCNLMVVIFFDDWKPIHPALYSKPKHEFPVQNLNDACEQIPLEEILRVCVLWW